MKASDLSKYIVTNYSNKSKDGITPLKLQKLLYYVKVWCLIDGSVTLEDTFEAWNFGPVIPEIYKEYKQFGKNPIVVTKNEFHIEDSNQKKLIDFIIENYIGFDAISLSAMTHQEEPWKNSYPNQIINEKDIISYYSKQSFSKNFPYSEGNKYYPIMSNLSYSYIFDMSEIFLQETSYNSFDEYKNQLNNDIFNLDDLDELIKSLT